MKRNRSYDPPREDYMKGENTQYGQVTSPSSEDYPPYEFIDLRVPTLGDSSTPVIPEASTYLFPAQHKLHLSTSPKWRKGKLWLLLQLPTYRGYKNGSVCLVKNQTEFYLEIGIEKEDKVIILFEINVKSSNTQKKISLMEREMIASEKKIIKNGYVRLRFMCLKSKSDFVEGVSKNRRNAQGVQTFLCATLYHSHKLYFYETEILWSPPPSTTATTPLSLPTDDNLPIEPSFTNNNDNLPIESSFTNSTTQVPVPNMDPEYSNMDLDGNDLLYYDLNQWFHS